LLSLGRDEPSAFELLVSDDGELRPSDRADQA
jgi:hypothetical protein